MAGRKKRTHATVSQAGKPLGAKAASREPKSMVIRIGAGEVGPSVSQLVKDVREMLEPGTASRLKERRNNRLKDYLTMAGPLGVTHLLLFSRSETGNTNMRLAVTPRGPTLHFKVETYSLCKDVRKALKRPKSGKNHVTPPLVSSYIVCVCWSSLTFLQLVMNNFTSPTSEGDDSTPKVPRHLEQLTTTMFQSLFPPIAPQKTPLSAINRVLLLNREIAKDDSDEGTYVLNLRHYAITTKASGLARPLRRLNAAEKALNQTKGRKRGLPNLGKLDDIADYMIGGENGEGYMTDATSGSEVDTDAEVEVLETKTRKVLSRKARQQMLERAEGGAKEKGNGVEKRAVKLVELGPRMKLRLTKVEEGVCNGKVMWHEYIHKSKEEVKQMEKKWEKKRQEKELRRKIQKENVERKKKSKPGVGAKGNEEDDEDEDYDMDEDEWDSEGLEGDAEMQLNEKKEDEGDWEDEREEIAAG
jgi:ribosome biogenesis protein SSF1/2